MPRRSAADRPLLSGRGLLFALGKVEDCGLLDERMGSSVVYAEWERRMKRGVWLVTCSYMFVRELYCRVCLLKCLWVNLYMYSVWSIQTICKVCRTLLLIHKPCLSLRPLTNPTQEIKCPSNATIFKDCALFDFTIKKPLWDLRLLMANQYCRYFLICTLTFPSTGTILFNSLKMSNIW